MRSITPFCLVGVGVALFGADVASAQDFFQRDRYQSVGERPQPEFDPAPVRVGTLVTRPVLEAGVLFNDNVLAVPDNLPGPAGTQPGPKSDTIIRIAPRVGVRTDWSRHEVSANVGVDHQEFLSEGDESHTDVTGDLRGRVDVNREIFIDGGVLGQSLTESRRNVASSGFIEPIEFTNVGADVGATFERDRIRATARVQTSKLDFDDTRTTNGSFIVDEDFRDRRQNTLLGRVSYAVSPDVAVFGQASLDERNYTASIADAATPSVPNPLDPSNRDSEGYTLAAGVDFELPVLLRGDIAVGFFEDDPRVGEPLDGTSVDARVEWFPSRLTTVTFTGARRATDPGIVDINNAIETAGRIRVDHELLRNVILFGEAGLQQLDFGSAARGDDEIVDFGVGATYKVSRRVHFDAFYRYYDRSSTVPTQEFNQNIVGLGLRLHP